MLTLWRSYSHNVVCLKRKGNLLSVYWSIMNYYAYLYVICVFIIILIYVFIKYKLIRPSIVGILNQANLKIIFNLKMLAFLC